MEITYGATVVKGYIPANKSETLAKVLEALKEAMQEPYDYYGDLTEVTISIKIGD